MGNKKPLYTCLACLFLIIRVLAAPANDLPVVRTTTGLVQGNVNSGENVYVFKGIPYAAPPVGNLRWKEPQPAIPWEGVRKCTTFGPNAMQPVPQPSGAYGPEILIPADGQISEDCLYLNVWAPVQQDRKRPVIVVIHGGGFTGGSGSVATLNGEEWAKKGAVVVSINYRLGIFGFLAHPALSAESPHHVSGNYGILDQIAALKWVKENIAAFGGDPDNVTANGGSAGSCSIHVMVGSPLAKGLFRRVISESGPLFKPGVSLTLKEAEQEGLNTMNKLSAHTVAEMRAIPASKLQEDHLRRHPLIDGYVLPDRLINVFLQGKQNNVDLLIGYNEGESGMEEAPLSAEAFIATAKKKYGNDADAFLQIYPAGSNEEVVQSQLHMFRDLIFAWENYTWARLQSQNGQCKVYFYYFWRGAPGQPYYGAFHGSQGAYAFHNLNKWNRPFEDWDRTLSEYMSSYWINFATTGNPNGKKAPRWPRFTAQKTKVLELGDEIKVKPLPAMPSFTFFEKDPQVALTGTGK